MCSDWTVVCRYVHRRRRRGMTVFQNISIFHRHTHTGIDSKPSGFWRVLTALVRNSSIQFFFSLSIFPSSYGFSMLFQFWFQYFLYFFYAQLLYSMCVFFSSIICSVHVCTCGSSTSGIRSSIRFKSMFCVLLFSGATIYQAFTLSK